MGATFTHPLVALVLDQTNTLLPGKSVTFKVAGPASFSGSTSLVVSTDSGGAATTSALVAGSDAGPVTVTASVSEMSGSAQFSDVVSPRTGTIAPQ